MWCSGLLAGCVAYSVTNPMDVVRTRLVLQQGRYGHRTIGPVFRAIVRNEGIGALFRGVGTRVISSAPGAALASFTYELAIRLSLKD